MKEVFVDTNYFVAILNPADQWHKHAVAVEENLENIRLVTTDFVLIEVLNYFSGYKEDFKIRVAKSVRLFIEDLEIQKIECSRESFLGGFSFYETRLDKGYSLTDCVSMNVMQELKIEEILTHDTHFAQEGFRILL